VEVDGSIGKSPCTVRGGGSVKAAERPVASIAEVAAAVEAAPERFRAALALAAWCSLRRGEMLGLQRRHINPLAGTVTIEQTLLPPMGGKAQLAPPKTEAGRRTLFVPANVMPLLVDHLAKHVGPRPDAWLFATSTGRDHVHGRCPQPRGLEANGAHRSRGRRLQGASE
jgi:integrase